MIQKMRRPVILAVALLAITSILGSGAYRKLRRQEPKQKTHAAKTLKADQVKTVPQIVSKVRGLEVSGAAILRQGTPEATLAIDIINNTDRSVMAIEISSGNENDWSSQGIDGMADSNRPQILIPPHSLKTFDWAIGSIMESNPITIAAASFSDGTEEGDTKSLEMMKRSRERSKAKRDAAQSGKEGPR